jgi:hypothetical protein
MIPGPHNNGADVEKTIDGYAARAQALGFFLITLYLRGYAPRRR